MSKTFSVKLLKWYHAHARELPWRTTKDPYKIWVSEAMLQQTTVKAVIDYYHTWLKTFPDVQSLAKAPVEKVLKAWQGLGYYNRARNFHKAAQIVVEKYDGEVPKDPEVLRGLPGFGPYMSASVASIAFDVKIPLVDANVRRVIMRTLNIHGPAVSALDGKILKFLNAVMPDHDCGDFNQALMELGAMICTTKEPKCNMCPVQSSCKAFEKGCQELIPEPKKVSLNEITAVIGLIHKGSKYLIQQRPEQGLLAGMWEFPGGKVESQKDKGLKTALMREIFEELGQECLVGDEFCRVRHYYTTNKVQLIAFHVTLTGDKFKLKTNMRWAGLKDLKKYPMPSGSAKIVEKLLGANRQNP
jgi:A/G-specific adenine glycosylase